MVEIFQGRARRRWSEEDKRRLVAETLGGVRREAQHPGALW
jgi:transposase-like protein